jgi:lysophospholipase L1-like esterase
MRHRLRLISLAVVACVLPGVALGEDANAARIQAVPSVSRACQTLMRDPPSPSAVPQVPQDTEWSTRAGFDALVSELHRHPGKTLFIGDSITYAWPKTIWEDAFAPYDALKLGMIGDRTQDLLWRLNNGYLAAPQAPRVIVLLIGTNNASYHDTGAEIAEGIATILKTIRTQKPMTHIVLLDILPRGRDPSDPNRIETQIANRLVERCADGVMIESLELGKLFLRPDGSIPKSLMPDFLHPSPAGYALMAEMLRPKIAAHMP